MFRPLSVASSVGSVRARPYLPGIVVAPSVVRPTESIPYNSDRSPYSTPRSRSPASPAVEYVDGVTPEASTPSPGWQGPSTSEEPRMGDYFHKRRDLLDILKSLHSTGYPEFPYSVRRLTKLSHLQDPK